VWLGSFQTIFASASSEDGVIDAKTIAACRDLVISRQTFEVP